MRVVNIFFWAAFSVLLTACHYSHENPNEHWDMTNEQRDSLDFVNIHHFTLNYNFTIIDDSIRLRSNLPSDIPSLQLNDSVTVYQNDKVVVADIAKTSLDSTSYWIKIARDQQTMGWIPEAKLLRCVVPCDPISQFIHSFSNSHWLAFYLLIGIAAFVYLYRLIERKRLFMVHFNDIDSLYPALLCLLTAFAAVLYGTIQTFVPDTWVEYYFYPTLNPFGQPLIMGTFLCSVWLMLMCGLAAIDDIRKQLGRSAGVSYLFGLACICIVLYIFFSLTVQIYIGYLCFVAYVVYAVRQYLRHYTAPYLCGHCGKPLRRLGRCPFCGTMNE